MRRVRAAGAHRAPAEVVVERKLTKPYRLIDLRDGRVWDCNTARAITDILFVLTMWPPRAAVYKYGRRFPHRLAGELAEVQGALEEWQP